MLKSIPVASMLSILTVALLNGCGENVVPKADVEQNAMKQLTATVGKPSPPITCPSDLNAKVGEKLTCAITLDGKVHDVAVGVTAVDGKDVKYDIEVASKPRG